jgi:hypothetical protein
VNFNCGYDGGIGGKILLGWWLWRLKVVVVVEVVVEGGYGGDVVVMEVVEAFGYGGS